MFKMKKYLFLLWFTMTCFGANAQLSKKNLDSIYQPLPESVHIYKSIDSIGGKPDVITSHLKNLDFLPVSL